MILEYLSPILGPWSRVAQSMPWRTGLIGLLLAMLAALAIGSAVRTFLEARSDRVAAGPIFALSGLVVLAISIVLWLVDGLLAMLDKRLLAERILLLMVPDRFGDPVAALRLLFNLPDDSARLLPPGPVHLPIAVAGATVLYSILVLWAGRTLAELTALEKKPDDVLARERAEQQKAIAQALKEGRSIPTTEVVSIPLADDLFGRTFKLLGHWTSVELVEERFVRWQRPLVAALGGLLFLALPAAMAGHLGAAFWAGAAIALDGLRRNLRTKQAPPDPAPKEEAQASEGTAPLPALRPLIEAVHRDAGPLVYAPNLPPAQPAQISPGTNLKAKRILDELRKELPFEEGLMMHQGLACDAFAARKNVVLATPPLSGKEALIDLLVLYTLLVEGENVLYLAPDQERAREAEERLRARAEAARWRWNVHAENLAGRAGSIDLARSQPGLVFADPDAAHRDLCGRQRDFQVYLAALGLVILPDIEEHHGARGAHMAHVLRRLRRAARAAATRTPELETDAERVRFLATAAPAFRDLGRFAERLAGRPFLVLGPEVDGAPQPDRVAFGLPSGAAEGDLHPAVRALGEALAQGFSAELFGYEDVLAAADVARANEIMLARGVATRGRSFAEGARGADRDEALSRAQVVIARASASRYAALPLLVSHLGWRAGSVPKTRIASLGAGEQVGVAAAGKEIKPEEEAAAAGLEGQVTEEAIAQADFERKVLLFLQPDPEPFASLLIAERPALSPADRKLGCALVVDPAADHVQRAHLRCALSESEIAVDELEREFSKSILEAELGPMGFHLDAPDAKRGDTPKTPPPPIENPSSGRLIERTRRTVDPTTGALRASRTLELSRCASPHASVALDASGLAVSVVDRHTGEALFGASSERALSAAYPGRIFVLGGRRYSVLPFEDQDQIAEGRVLCEREERPLTTSKIRRVSVKPIERRAASSPSAQRSPGDRRVGPVRTLGGASFTLEHSPAEIREELLGVRRHGPDGGERDTTLYSDPIACPFLARAALLGLPKSSFGEIEPPALHALAHLFRVTLPAFVHHREEDLEIVWIASSNPTNDPAIAFIDAHPGGAGFAESITTEVIANLVQWSLGLTRRCPAHCRRREGCPRCVQIARCHEAPENVRNLDKFGADRVLALLLGEKTANALGPAPPQTND